MVGSRRAFTLIELMIAIAIIAIVFGVATASYLELGAFQRRLEYGESLVQSTSQLEVLRKENFDALPPQVATLDKTGRFKLSRDFVVADSIKVSDAKTGAEITDWIFNAEGNSVNFKLPVAGRTVTIEYEYCLPSTNSTYFCDSSGNIPFRLGTGVKVRGVLVASGEQLRPMTDYKIADGRIVFSPSLAKKLIVLDYVDEKNCNRVSGCFLDEQLRKTKKVSGTKLLEVREPFRTGGWRMSLPLIKERKP